MDPAKSILDKVGYETVAEITGKHLSRVYRWTYTAEKGGSGGIIPHEDALKILDYSRQNGLGLTEADFLRATEPEGASVGGQSS